MAVFLGRASPALRKRVDTPTFGTLPSLAIRRVNISLEDLVEKDSVQPSLFGEQGKEAREAALAQTMVAVRERFGKNAVLAGTSLLPEANARERNLQIGGHRA